jgi:ABC-type cobalamin/Fe3+-siderophores transport system ATPase subunit
MEIELKNYRAFSDEAPARWTLEDGFTALVGVNNSGKSSLLRFFHEIRSSLERTADRETLWALLTKSMEPEVAFQSVADNHEVFHNGNDRPMSATFFLADPRDSEPSAIRLKWQRNLRLSAEVEWQGEVVSLRRIKDWPLIEAEARSWLPTLDLGRYFSAFNDFFNSIYLGPFRNAVNLGGQASYYDLRIGEQFIAHWDQIKTGNERAQNKSALAVQDELREIFGLNRLEINASPGNATMQVIADDEPYQLQEQGAGFAQFVVVMAYVATLNPAFILIDEPELNLHPSLQLDFLTTLARYSTRGVAFATHSVGLAKAVGQRVYSVLRDSSERRQVQELSATRDYAEFLGELSYSGYTALGFNRILLVEGPTEVPTVQAWLRLYGIEHKVVLMPLGGASLINASSAATLSEISRITTEVSVLIDSEREAEEDELSAERAAFVSDCEQLGFDVHVLERRALENYLPDEAIKKVKGEKYRQLGEFEARTAADPIWGKNENWRIAAEMDRGSLEATDLGAFFLSLQNAVSST